MTFKRICLLVAAAIITTAAFANEQPWKGKWIIHEHCSHSTNTWVAFAKIVDLNKIPQSVTARIAVDSRYWLWINGEPVVREGCLKRGPAPGDGYYDSIEIAPYLKEGKNYIAVLVWYFGRAGFSHMGSGIAGLLFDAQGDGVEILSEKGWRVEVENAFEIADNPPVNHRLPEGSLRYDARKSLGEWYLPENLRSNYYEMSKAFDIGIAVGEPPFGKLVKRPIPMWKDYGVSEYESTQMRGDTLVCALPYNCHVHPIIKLDAPAGKLIKIETDHEFVGGQHCVRAEYVTRDGSQEFECYDWMNGQYVYYILPEGVTLQSVAYRETGYDTDFSGYFRCDDEMLNEYWLKAARTLYVCMRDTYYDCPDRERSQWWGDEVNEFTEAFFCLSPSAQKLALKGIYELVNWQKADGSLHSPIPASNYAKELPMQMLASVGWYGFHNFWFYSGDDSFIGYVYPAVKKYLHEVWELDADGLPIYRRGDWDWPDWTDEAGNCDKYALQPLWYLLALQGELAFAEKLGYAEDAAALKSMIETLKKSYNERFWTGSSYRSEDYELLDDDRVQGLAVLSGVAGADKYPALIESLSQHRHASAYMEKYSLEALFAMGATDAALERMHILLPTIMKPDYSTLWEAWNWGGTPNHAWTGACIIEMERKIAGIEPLEPGFKRFKVEPQMGNLKFVETGFETIYGMIEVRLQRKGRRIEMEISVPEGTVAEVPLSGGKTVTLQAGRHILKK